MTKPDLTANKIKVTEGSGIENIRIVISTHLTKILMLYGRLHGDYNTRYLPVTVSSILMLISELEILEKKYYGFSDILAENIERRERYTNVFHIPSALQNNPSVKGLKGALTELTDPMLSSYCAEDKKFLQSLGVNISLKTKQALFQRTLKNCDLLKSYSIGDSVKNLNDLKSWCEAEYNKLS
ncbi:MAG: hypothetical protein K0S32_964 [Bacteroidetes bacterium]|jgi:hypothetical protein|nr:hypothetical protein [Bacteroidota bacterium]